jgi:hypothetical protein
LYHEEYSVKARKEKYGYRSVYIIMIDKSICTVDAEIAACPSHSLAQVEERAGSVPD